MCLRQRDLETCHFTGVILLVGTIYLFNYVRFVSFCGLGPSEYNVSSFL